MVHLAIYFLSMGLVVLGALCFVSGLSVKGRIRLFLACAAACVPIGAGIWLFTSAGLRPKDLDRLLRQASHEIQGFVEGVRRAQESHQEIRDILGGRI